MPTPHRVAVAAFMIVAATGMTGCHSLAGQRPAEIGAPGWQTSGGTCHVRDEHGQPLPDSACTPGAANPQVTEQTMADTICKPGWTKTVRPPASYTNKLKHDQIGQYGYRDTNPRDYEEDHLISLELGGAPADPHNLWPEPGKTPNPKDRVENDIHAALCQHRVHLADAQQAISSDWTTAEARLGLSR